jgi:hypothetical protein
MLRVMLREMLRWLLRSMPTDVLREMLRLLPTVVLPVLRTLLLRQVPTTFANRGAKRMLTTVPTVLLTLLRTDHDPTTTRPRPRPRTRPRTIHAGQLPYVQGERQMMMQRTAWKPCLHDDTTS